MQWPEYTLGHVPTSFTLNNQRYYILTDQIGSPKLIADENGNTVKQLDYDSFGNLITDSNPDFAIPFGFAGGLHDNDTGLIRFGYRDYDPETGRWTARDPIGFAGGDTNLYGYVLGDPVNHHDPSGLIWAHVAKGLINAGLNLISQLLQNGGSLDCVNWADVGVAGLKGALGGSADRLLAIARSKGAVINSKEARKIAEALGYKKDGSKSKGQDVYVNKKSDPKYITRDVDGHNGGAFKGADKSRDLGSKSTRKGTYDSNLNRVGD